MVQLEIKYTGSKRLLRAFYSIASTTLKLRLSVRSKSRQHHLDQESRCTLCYVRDIYIRCTVSKVQPCLSLHSGRFRCSAIFYSAVRRLKNPISEALTREKPGGSNTKVETSLTSPEISDSSLLGFASALIFFGSASWSTNPH